jgi:hypothetical protein
MYIFQSHDLQNRSDCDHKVDLDRSNTMFPYMSRRPVARLQGLAAEWPFMSMTALERVAVSPGGSRIAIALWDKVLIYHIDPDVLSEPWLPPCIAISEASVADGYELNTTWYEDLYGHDRGGSFQHREELSLIPPRGTIAECGYYPVVKDEDFGDIVEFWPQVIKLAKKAVARKMMWLPPELVSSEASDPETRGLKRKFDTMQAETASGSEKRHREPTSHGTAWPKATTSAGAATRQNDRLVIMTDRGIQVWDFGAQATGKRETIWLDDLPEVRRDHDG